MTVRDGDPQIAIAAHPLPLLRVASDSNSRKVSPVQMAQWIPDLEGPLLFEPGDGLGTVQRPEMMWPGTSELIEACLQPPHQHC